MVPADARCASALPGSAKYDATWRQMPELVGFHAAYDRTSGSETGASRNALLGAYVNKLGLSYLAVIYITQASPTSMTWLSADDANKNEIDVTLLVSSASSDDREESAAPLSEKAMRKNASEFVEMLFTLWSSPNDRGAEILPNLYGPRVPFYGRELSNSNVLADKLNSINRWPQRLYKLRQGTLTVKCDAALAACQAAGIVDWVVRSPTRNAQGGGSSTFEYAIAMRTGSTRILVEGGSVISKVPSASLR